MQTYLDTICEGQHLSAHQAAAAFSELVSGKLDPIQMSALLVSLRAKGEHPDEIAGAAMALRRGAVPFPSPGYEVADTCGTGGDGSGTINISTAVAVVAAEMGIPVAKHGNRSITSLCGSADVLELHGVNIVATPNVSRACLDEVGLCFLFAPRYHRGVGFAMPVRRSLGIRTIMNILGPLVNPARPEVQVVGVYDSRLCEPMARALGLLGCRTALVVHGSGLDEIAVHGTTRAVMLENNETTELELHPAQAGLDVFPLEQLRGGDPRKNAAALGALLAGRGGARAHQAAVAMNAGALSWIFGATSDLKEGVGLALEVIRSGRAAQRLVAFARASHGA